MRMSLRHSFFIWWTNKVEYAILIEECDFLNYIQNDSIINKQFEFIEEENKIYILCCGVFVYISFFGKDYYTHIVNRWCSTPI